MSRIHSKFDRFLWKLRPFKQVRLAWLLELKRQNLLSKKIKVGFGPVHTDESTLTNRKYHIDPIVNGINRFSDRYVADIFFPAQSLSRFDILVFLKHIEYTSEKEIQRLKEAGTRILFNISDNPSGCELNYETTDWFLQAVDRLLLLNPKQGQKLPQFSGKFRNISPPIIDERHKASYTTHGPVRIFWDGFASNLYTLDRLLGIVKQVAKDSRVPVEMWINSNIPEKDDGNIHFKAWSIKNWKNRLLACDIGALIKPVDDSRQQKKPPTKLIQYMGAGLPVVCTPSGADREVLNHGETGFFAYSDQEWFDTLKRLAEDANLRARIGRAAHSFAQRHFSIRQVTTQYIRIFDELGIPQPPVPPLKA